MPEHKNPDAAFARLARSKFRSRFHLSDDDRQYIAEKGIETIRRHCEDIPFSLLNTPVRVAAVIALQSGGKYREARQYQKIDSEASSISSWRGLNENTT